MAHTSGPWSLVAGAEAGQVDVIGAGGVLIAELGNANWARKFEGTVVEGNARLIAAAPDLLAALKAVVEFDSRAYVKGSDLARGFLAAKKVALAAITKAEAS